MAILFPCRGDVSHDYHVDYPDPIVAQAGEPITVTERVCFWQEQPEWLWRWCHDQRGKGGWVPHSYIARQGEAATLRYDYSAHELEARRGDVVMLLKEACGWYWCQNRHGEQGWLPIDHLLLPIPAQEDGENSLHNERSGAIADAVTNPG